MVPGHLNEAGHMQAKVRNKEPKDYCYNTGKEQWGQGSWIWTQYISDMREKTMVKPIVFCNAFMLIKETISKIKK